MLVAVFKLYFIGTALTVLAVIYGIVDSIGGLMYIQDQRYFLESSAASIQQRLLMKRREDDLESSEPTATRQTLYTHDTESVL